MVVYYLGTNIFFFIFYKQGYLNFFKYLIILFFFFINKYLTILLSISGPLIPYTPSYYKNKSLEGGLKIIVRDFKPKIL